MQVWKNGGTVPSKSFEDITIIFSDICGFADVRNSII
jgi:hypothetical protein